MFSILIAFATPSVAFQSAGWSLPGGYPRLSSALHETADSKVESSQVSQLKGLLIQKVSELRKLQERDGDVPIDFGVKGGELNSTSRAPQKVDYYSISKDVGSKAGEVLSICQWLSKVSPIEEPTKYLGDMV